MKTFEKYLEAVKRPILYPGGKPPIKTDEQKWYGKFKNFIAETIQLLQLGDEDEALIELVAECINEFGGSHNADYLFKEALDTNKHNKELINQS